MPVNPAVLMPLWMLVIAAIGIFLALAWILRALLVTRRDTSREVGDIPMAPAERSQWAGRVEHAAARYEQGEIDLRGLHLELASVLRGFASARSGEDISSATVREILDMADTAGPRSVEARLAAVMLRRRPLDANPLGYIGELLAVWEQPSFDRDPDAAADTAVTDAREVVSRW
ncbi:MAG: alpha-amylase [Actinomyces sp.]|uniref:alpha-amylase n=1 Tax=Actinomyces sp. TaxID=29317 RepID=UPI0026DCECC9|nr:alpha-amylase [Actinomyces sp.]MDO4243956.1 alpha-amylase [Actinomyces sp.]